MAVYDLDEARDRLPALLQQAERGELVLIARAGMPIARVVPIDNGRDEARRSLAKAILAMPQARDDDDLFERTTIAPRDIEF